MRFSWGAYGGGDLAHPQGAADLVLWRGCHRWARNPGCSSILAVQDGSYVGGYIQRYEGVVGGYRPGCWRGSSFGYHNHVLKQTELQIELHSTVQILLMVLLQWAIGH